MNNLAEIYSNLYQLTRITFNLYKRLSEVDSNGYDKYLNLLRLQSVIESSYYNSICDNNVIMELLDMINNESLYEYSAHPIIMLADIELDDELINYRIYQILSRKVMMDDNYFKNTLDDDFKIYTSNSESTNYIKNITTLLKEEEARQTINLLGDDKFKYCFINPIIEEELLESDFKIKNSSFNDNISCPSTYDIFKNYIYSKYGINNSIDLVDELINLSNDPELDIYDEDSFGYNCLNLFLTSFKVNLLFIESGRIDVLYKYFSIVFDKEKLKISEEEPEKEEKLEFIGNLIEKTFDNNDLYRQMVNKDSKIKRLIK